MSRLTLAPYVEWEPDGSDPRISFPVKTPGAFVLVESRRRGALTVRDPAGDGARIAIEAARAYVRAHRGEMDRLYGEVDRIRPTE